MKAIKCTCSDNFFKHVHLILSSYRRRESNDEHYINRNEPGPVHV